ncbi:glycoside hydrolase family 2 TIM barrel-domain containing protein [Actinoplanes sp. NEAU-A12]|uniref:beta-galactosidase n=1 Tax=Actinoplanes sandaracinus TaxID=3045177 RepID=A0ABT6WKS8_9ACTN|nr:glycoside hydrolase family 2 TIM barrel-domain containing protein [Actinoplanes sandaracinus]MDI6100323.1 glycoside hydrolase family 2 TIM barrel-domain containing protein [Actinoplanes sandaracinus]
MRIRFGAAACTALVALLGLAVPAPAAATSKGAAATARVPGGPQSVEDVYRYLENPQMTGEGQEPPHADLRPTGSSLSLNGGWRMKLFDRPDDVPAGFSAAGFDGSAWPKVTVPHTWQSDFIDHPMFRNIPEEVWPDNPPFVPRDVNPTGAYLKTFDVPKNWAGGREFLRFEGVTSGYFVWVNGAYAGYDQGGYTPAEFDVTDLLRPGRNTVAVQVHRWGSGSYLEDFDQWRYSGIFRDVSIYRTGQVRLRDAYITTDLDAGYRDAALTARVDVAGTADGHTVRGTLRDAKGKTVVTVSGPVSAGQVTLTTTVPAPAKWTAEEPNLYTLGLELIAPDGRAAHVTSQPVGFRDIEIRDKQLLVNGQRILVKGVNRAETDPDTGRHVTREAQRQDVLLMKKLHINAVRTSHYPSDPYFYDLADKYGLWLADEVDIETHSRENCPSNCLASKPEWQAAFADRFAAMVARDKNRPSVLMWDTGNEAGLGAAHHAMAQWADTNEPTRPLYHQSNSPDGDAPFADISGPRYPTPASLENKARTGTKPIIMGEYAHAMGNSMGNFDEFWAIARRQPSMQGGFVWDWAEQDLRQPLVLTPDSSRNRIQAFLVGKPALVAGHRGQAISLSSLDDFVDVFRDRRLDVTTAVTLDAWVKPGQWAGSFPIVTKGRAYAMQMRDQDTLELVVNSGSVAADVPANWYDNWHRVTGTYDGAEMRLYIDGVQVAAVARTGAIDPGLYEVNIGRNAETQQDDLRVRTGRGLVDDVRIYGSALTAGQLAADPSVDAVLALDFDRSERRGDFLSLGLSLSGTDGMVSSDRVLQPETEEVAWAHSPVRFTAVDAAAGRVRVTNEQTAGTLRLRLDWSLTEVDRRLRGGDRKLTLAPGETVDLALGAAPANPHDRERWLNLSVSTTEDLPWAKRGWVFARDQFSAGGRVVPGILPAPAAVGAPVVTRNGSTVTVRGKGWKYRFENGALTSLAADGRELLKAGPELDVYRPPTSNEIYGWGTADREIWHEVGLDRLQTTVEDVSSTVTGAAVEITVRSTAAAPGLADAFAIGQTLRYRIDGQGTLTLGHSVRARGSRAGSLPYLPRVGVKMRVPASMDDFTWYGTGPHETYNDRSSGATVGVWRSDVDDQYVPYARPQAGGNHTGTRWAALSDGKRGGILVGSPVGEDLDVSVSQYDDLDRAEYAHQLPLVRNNGWVTLHAATGETGMGETPNSVLAPYRLSPTRAYDYELVLRPLDRLPDASAAAPCPPDVTLDTDGSITAGVAERVSVRVDARCAAGLRDVTATLEVPSGWQVTPASAALGSVAAGTPAVAEFTVTAPAGTDWGQHQLTAAVTSATPDGFRSTVGAAATVRTPLPDGSSWVSDLPFVQATNGWGPVERDRSNAEQAAGDGRPLTLGGVAYDKGIGVHAVSAVTVDLTGRGCTTFRADTGVDDEMGNSGSVVFEVWVDGVLKASSGRLTGSADARPIEADVTGGSRLELRVTDAGDGVGADHGDWAAARLLC